MYSSLGYLSGVLCSRNTVESHGSISATCCHMYCSISTQWCSICLLIHGYLFSCTNSHIYCNNIGRGWWCYSMICATISNSYMHAVHLVLYCDWVLAHITHSWKLICLEIIAHIQTAPLSSTIPPESMHPPLTPPFTHLCCFTFLLLTAHLKHTHSPQLDPACC